MAFSGSGMFAETVRQMLNNEASLDLDAPPVYKARLYLSAASFTATEQEEDIGVSAVVITNDIFTSNRAQSGAADIADVTIGSPTAPTADAPNDRIYVDGDNVTFQDVDGSQTCQGVVVYVDGTTDHAVCFSKFGADIVTASTTDITIQWSTSPVGIWDVTYSIA